MWPEVQTAKAEQRHELVLHGKDVSDRVQTAGGTVDEEVFNLVKLNFLEISEAKLQSVPETLSSLVNLTSLVLKSNQLTKVPEGINSLTKLKLLDVSGNQLGCLPPMSQLTSMTSLNVSVNSLEGELTIPGLENCAKLTVVDVSGNKLTSLASLEAAKLAQLAEVTANHNSLESLSSDIANNWPTLKKFDVSHNNLKNVPSSLASIAKLKEFNLVSNPLSDNRLRKMCEQKGTKSVLDYIKANSGKEEKGGGKGGKKGKKGAKEAVQEEEDISELCQTLKVLGFSEDYPEIVVDDEVKDVRPYLVCCYVTGLDLGGDNLKKFLSLQTKLHKGVCGNRTVATIATHDRALVTGPLVFTAKPPSELSIVPLMHQTASTAEKLVTHLKNEAEALRKEKKRSSVTGLHQYLHILDRWPVYPCLMDGDRVISFPPVTNSNDSRISDTTTSLLVEVSSSTKLADAKLVMDSLLLEMLDIWESFTVTQARVVAPGGELKVTYPSKTDLTPPQGKKIRVVRN